MIDFIVCVRLYFSAIVSTPKKELTEGEINVSKIGFEKPNLN